MNIQPLKQNARVLGASLAGTAVEFYDFFIYATAAAIVFGPLFFPAESSAAQTLLAFMSFGIAFIARPIGAIAFGHFGDRVGRKSTLVASLLLMGGATLLIAFLPTYAQVGWIAPVLLCVLRFGQGFGLGGEWGGAALLAVENAPKGWAARFGAVPQLGSPLGFLAANGMFLLLGAILSEAEFMDWGWRIPFLASALLVAIGMWVRFKIDETPAYRAAMAREKPEAMPVLSVLSRNGGAVLAGSAGVVATFAMFYLTTAYALAQAGEIGYDRQDFLMVLLGANIFYALGIVLSSILADFTSPQRSIALGGVGTALFGLVFSAGLASGSLLIAALTIATGMLVLGITNAPLGCWLSSLFPVKVRYSGMSLAFNAGGIIGGALTPIAAQMLALDGLGSYVGGLLVAAGLLTCLGVALSRPIQEEALSV